MPSSQSLLGDDNGDRSVVYVFSRSEAERILHARVELSAHAVGVATGGRGSLFSVASAGFAARRADGMGVRGERGADKDHTADIQIRSWGSTIEQAFEGAALGMFNYMVRP